MDLSKSDQSLYTIPHLLLIFHGFDVFLNRNLYIEETSKERTPIYRASEMELESHCHAGISSPT